MSECPKCGFTTDPGAVDCPVCGLIFAKYRATPASSPPATAAGAPAAAGAPSAAAPHRAPAHAESYPLTHRVTRATLDQLAQARPWIRFLAISGMVSLVLMILGGMAMLLGAARNPRFVPVALVYIAYGIVGFVVLVPLNRSAAALDDLSYPNVALESFAAHQLAFFRRWGILTAILVAIAGVGFVLALILGVAAAVSR